MLHATAALGRQGLDSREVCSSTSRIRISAYTAALENRWSLSHALSSVPSARPLPPPLAPPRRDLVGERLKLPPAPPKPPLLLPGTCCARPGIPPRLRLPPGGSCVGHGAWVWGVVCDGYGEPSDARLYCRIDSVLTAADVLGPAAYATRARSATTTGGTRSSPTAKLVG